jgi:xanthine/uracil permease
VRAPHRRSLGTAIAADGGTTVPAAALGGPATTTCAENIRVMAATRVHSTAAYRAAACFAVVFGPCPKLGAVIAAVPGGALGGVTVALYGTIGPLGARIRVESRADPGNPVNLVPPAAGVVAGIGDVTLRGTGDLTLSGIALGTVLVPAGHHGLRLVAPAYTREAADPAERAVRPAGAAAQDPPDAPRGG